MKRLVSLLIAAAFLINVASSRGQISRPFGQQLVSDKQTPHILSRLTFGARPGDAAEVRRLGLDQWLELQLHPERIPENPLLESRLQPLESLRLAPQQVAQKYPPSDRMMPRPPVITPSSLLDTQQLSIMMNGGSVELRRTVVNSLSPDTRRQLLANSPPRLLDGLGLEMEIANARRQDRQAAEALQQEYRRTSIMMLDEILTPEQTRIARTGTDQEKLTLLNSFDPHTRRQLLRRLGPQPFLNIPQLRREALAATAPQQLVSSELIESKLYRAIYSNRQLEEVLLDFWTNHFNVFNGKGLTRVLLTSYERDAIRPHVFGRFRDMLLATARHPAMLIYLDNALSEAPPDNLADPLVANGQAGLNENYGRELMELHTLGVDGGYTQQDVIAVARAFTGWTVYDPSNSAEFRFNPATHDRKEKLVLGHTLPAGRGEEDGLEVIDILNRHPSTARFISKKLAQRFVADNPPQALVDRMAATFTTTDGDLRAVLQTLFASVEFSSEGAWQTKLKSPLEMVVSAIRALNANTLDTYAIAQHIAEMGQPLYGKIEPTGYPNTGETWASTAGVLGRLNFATTLALGEVPGVHPDLQRFEARAPADIAAELLGRTPAPTTLDSLERGLQGKDSTLPLVVTVVLASPEFQRR